MAQHIGNQRVGVPRAKPGKAPIDTFFEAVQKGGPTAKPVRAAKPPKAPRAKVGPYTKPVRFKAGTKYPKGQPVSHVPGLPPAHVELAGQGSGVRSAEPKAQQYKPRTRPLTAAEKLAISTGTQRRAAQKLAGLSPKDVAAVNKEMSFNPIDTRTLSQLGNEILNTPAGIYQSVKAPVEDIAGGQFTFPHTRRLGEAFGKSFAADFQHPNERSGNVAMDLISLLTMGAGTVSRTAAAGRALAETEGSTAARLGAAARAGGTRRFATLKAGEAEARIPLSGNSLIRPFQRSRVARQQAALDAGAGSHATVLKELTAQSRFGRVLRDTSRTVSDLRLAPGHEAQHALSWATKRVKVKGRVMWKTDPAREMSLALVGMFGDAALKTPGAVVERFATRHQEIIHDLQGRMARVNASGAKQLQRQVDAQHHLIQSARAARSILTTKPPEFQAALSHVRNLSKIGENEMEHRGLLDPARGSTHLAQVNAFYHNLPEGVLPQAPDGSFYFSMHSRYANPGKIQSATNRSVQPGPYGVPPPAKTGMVGQSSWTGKALEHGLPSVTHAVMDQFNRRMRFSSALDTWQTLYNAASPVRQTVHDIPIRDDGKITVELRNVLGDAQKIMEEHPTPDGQLPPGVMTKLRELILPQNGETAGIGQQVKDVRWLNPNFIKDHSGVSVGKPEDLLKVFDSINNFARVGTLYFRPAYALNALGNTGMALVDQGAAAPWRIYQGLKSHNLYGQKVTAGVDAAMGEGRSLAQAVTTGRGARVSRGLAQGWNKTVDLWYRRSAFYHEAAKQGYHGKAQLDELFRRGPSGKFVHEQKIAEIARVAQDTAVHFDSMTPVERAVIRRIIYFYPWISRASAWAVRTAFEHPIKTDLALHLGDIGMQGNPLFKNMPAWAQQAGMFPTGGSHGGLPDTVNPQSVFTPTTLAQAAMALQDLAVTAAGGKTTGTASGNLTPFLQYLVGNLMSAPTQSGRLSGLPGMVQSMPEATFLQRLGVDLPGVPKPSKTYPQTGLSDALMPWIFGGLAPRPTAFTGAGGPTPTAAQLTGGGTLQGGSLQGGTLQGGTLDSRPGSITPAQHRRITHLLQQKRKAKARR